MARRRKTMTNGEKFKTAKERAHKFSLFCESQQHGCNDCELTSCSGDECRYAWLDLEYKEELKLCPFCGGEARIIDLEDPEYKYYQIRCSKCMCKTESHLGMEETIAAWNRRV
jgi:Lar family restriction alleviation protein